MFWTQPGTQGYCHDILTQNWNEAIQPSLRDLINNEILVPALKRRAIVICPCRDRAIVDFPVRDISEAIGSP